MFLVCLSTLAFGSTTGLWLGLVPSSRRPPISWVGTSVVSSTSTDRAPSRENGRIRRLFVKLYKHVIDQTWSLGSASRQITIFAHQRTFVTA